MHIYFRHWWALRRPLALGNNEAVELIQQPNSIKKRNPKINSKLLINIFGTNKIAIFLKYNRTA